MAASIQRFYITQGDNLPALVAVITHESDGTAYNLTGHTELKFSMTLRGASAAKVNATATVVGSPNAGTLTYEWTGTDTDTPGVYDGQFHGKDAYSKLVSFPNGGHFEVHVIRRV